MKRYMNVRFYVIASFVVFFLFGCNQKKKQILEEFRSLSSLLENGSPEEIIASFDEESVDFIEFLTDTSNLHYEIMKEYGDRKKLTLFTTVFNHDFGNVIRGDSLGMESFLLYLRLTEVPLFSMFREQKLMEDLTETGDENYVVVGTQVGDNAYVTTKIHFQQDSDGNFRLNLLNLLKVREKILRQAYKQYRRDYSLRKIFSEKEDWEGPGEQEPDDMLASFLANRKDEEHQLRELRFRR